MLDSSKVRDMLTTEQVIQLCCFLQEDDTYFFDAYGHPIFSTLLDHPNEGGGSWKEYYYPETKLFHCFGKGTRIITDQGIKEIQNLINSPTTILNGNGEWETVVFKSYGIQKILKLTLRRYNKTQEIYTTPEHEWLLKRKKTKVKTQDLKIGDYLERAVFKEKLNIALDPTGIIHGYCYGDGTIIYKHKTRRDTRYRIIGYTPEKEKVLDYLSKAQVNNILFNTTKNNGIVYKSALFDSEEEMKEVPSLNKPLSYLLGFLAGYFLADGCCSCDRVSLCNIKKDDLIKIQDICTKCKILTTTLSEVNKKQGFKSKYHKFYILRLVRSSLPDSFFITEKRTQKEFINNSVGRWQVMAIEDTHSYEEVYCCQTSTHSFALDGFILTGNCYTRGESYDIFELVRRAKGFNEFIEAYRFVVKYFNFQDDGSPEQVFTHTDDWEIFQTIQDFSKTKEPTGENKPIQENLLEYFYPLAAPVEWQKDHISPEVMKYYGIRVDSALHKIIIPHRDISGNLIGIRGRTYDPFELDEGKKYMPVFIQGDMYNHMLGKNLFGLYENQETIKKIKKICIFEAEKSVLQMASIYGIHNNWSVAVCGSNISKEQMFLILGLGVEEVILAFDADHLGKQFDEDTINYEQKLMKMAKPLLPYFNVSIIFDYDHILPHKASPSDEGQEKFEELYRKRIRLNSYENKTQNRSKKRGGIK